MNTDNIDQAELDKFGALASRWWDPDSEFKPLHAINPLRLGFILEKTRLKGKKVVDIGCGGGILSESLAQQGADVTAIDMSEAPLKVAKLHLYESQLKIDYRQTTAEQLSHEQAGQYDIVTCMEMLEHVPDPASVVEACQKLVKPGGWVFFSTINRNPKSYLFAIVGAEYILNLLPKGTHDYARFIRPSELGRWLRQSSLEMDSIIGMGYNPLLAQYFLSADTSVNYLMATQKPA